MAHKHTAQASKTDRLATPLVTFFSFANLRHFLSKSSVLIFLGAFIAWTMSLHYTTPPREKHDSHSSTFKGSDSMRQPRLVVREEVGEDSVIKLLVWTTASLHSGKPSRVAVTDSNEHSSFRLYSYSLTACFKCSCHEAL